MPVSFIGTSWFKPLVTTWLIKAAFFSSKSEISSLFLGLILLSIPLIIKTEKDSLKGKYYNIIFLIIGVLIVSLITYFNPISGSEKAINITNINIHIYYLVYYLIIYN